MEKENNGCENASRSLESLSMDTTIEKMDTDCNEEKFEDDGYSKQEDGMAMEIDEKDKGNDSDIDENDHDNKEESDEDTGEASGDNIDGDIDVVDHLMKVQLKKEEGNQHFKASDWAQAGRCYRKAVNLLKSLREKKQEIIKDDPQFVSLSLSVHTNLSTAYFRQEKYRQSRDVAVLALGFDRDNVKALYRKIAAARKLGMYGEVIDDLKRALKLDPTNRDLRKEWKAAQPLVKTQNEKEKLAAGKLRKAMSGSGFLYNDKEEEKKRKAAEEKKAEILKKEKEKQLRQQYDKELDDNLNSTNEHFPTFDEWKKKKEQVEDEKRKAERAARELEEKKRREMRKKQNSNNEKETDDDGMTEEELSILKGYKKTRDGRTTSYFTREISTKEKEMIGNIAPQRITGAVSTTPTASSGSSAWNSAQTWEEKNTSDWCINALRKHLKGTSAGSFAISSIESINGDACVAVSSGRKRYIFDFKIELKFTYIVGESELASGKILLQDVCSGTVDNGEYEINLSWDKSRPHTSICDSCNGELIPAVKANIIAFVREFTESF